MKFINKLHEKLSGFDGVEIGGFEDGSAMWINVPVGHNQVLEISFDGNGNNITGIALFKEIVQVVDHDKLWEKKSK